MYINCSDTQKLLDNKLIKQMLLYLTFSEMILKGVKRAKFSFNCHQQGI